MNSESDITPFQGLLGENVTLPLSPSLKNFCRPPSNIVQSKFQQHTKCQA